MEERNKINSRRKTKIRRDSIYTQDNSVFPDMTVEENLLMGGFIKDKTEES